MKDRRAIIALLVFLAVIGGIVYASRSSGSSDDTENASDNTPSTGVTTTTTALPPVTKDDFDSIVRKINDLENELFESPDPNRVSEVMTGECSCYGDTQTRLQTLKDKGWHISGANIVIESTSPYETTADAIEGVVQINSAKKPTVDRSGKVVEQSPSGTFQPLVYQVKRGQDGVWRLSDRHLPEEVF